MAVCYSLSSQPPKGFSDEIWKTICKTPCSDVLLGWVSVQLVNQDVKQICDILSVSWTDSQNARSNSTVFSDVLSTWLRKRHSEDTHLSDLIHPLAVLNVKSLDADSLLEKTKDLCDQGSDFKYNNGDGGSQHQMAIRSDSGIGESSLHPMVSPIQCTEYSGLFQGPIQEEETALRIYSELVTGVAQSFQSSCPNPRSKVYRQKLKSLRVELRDLQNKFASLIQHTYNDLAGHETSVESLRVFLTQKCVDEHNEIPYFSNFTVDIMKKLTFEEIFAHLSRIGAWHFLSYLILKDIFIHFQDQSLSPKLISQIKAYEEEIEKFKENTLLIDFLAVWGGRCVNDEELPCCRSVIVKSIGDPSSFTITDACDMASLIAGEFSLTKLGSLGGGSTGSIYIKWLVPPAATKHMLKIMKNEAKRPVLLQFGVLQLAVERTVFKSKYQYESIHELSVANPRLFWGGMGDKELVWRRKSREVFTHNKKTGEFHWFRGAELNVSENCLDQHVKHSPHKTALIWERDDGNEKRVTYKELLEQTCRVANVLKKRGINKGDVVVICMPTMPLAVASMLACARIGAIHCVVFSDFNDKVLRQRITEVKAKGVITADIRVIGGETNNLKEKIVKALSNGDTSVEFVLVAKRSDTPVSSSGEVAENNTHCCSVTDSDGFYFSLEKEMQEVPSECDPVPMDGEDLLFIVYTSGTQIGTSKAVYHTQAGYLLYTKLTYKFMFNPAPDDIMGCVSDLGWIAAHSYVVYGPLSNGNTTLLFESTATYPDKDRYWKMVQNLKLTHFYTVPSVLKELRATKDSGVCQIKDYDLSSLKVIASGGEPIPPDIEQWYYKEVGKGKCLFLDTWGQTELGGTGIVRWEAPEGKERKDFPSSKSFALFGVDWDKSKEGMSELYLKQPIPGMGKFVLFSSDSVKKPYEEEHFKPNGYSTDDIVGHEQDTGLFRVKGRKDRTLFFQGVWLSLTEVEDCLRVKYSGICDAQVINCQNSNNKQGSLCVVMQTPPSTSYDNKGLASFYLISALAAKVGGRLILEGLRIQIYFLPLAESMKQYFQTATRKTSHTMLKNFLTHHQQSPSSNDNNQRWQDIKEKELLKFCQNNSFLAIPAQ